MTSARIGPSSRQPIKHPWGPEPPFGFFYIAVQLPYMHPYSEGKIVAVVDPSKGQRYKPGDASSQRASARQRTPVSLTPPYSCGLTVHQKRSCRHGPYDMTRRHQRHQSRADHPRRASASTSAVGTTAPGIVTAAAAPTATTVRCYCGGLLTAPRGALRRRHPPSQQCAAEEHQLRGGGPRG